MLNYFFKRRVVVLTPNRIGRATQNITADMMKAKLKSPEIAKKKGFEYVKTTLKKALKTLGAQEVSTPLSFFYDSEFDYGKEGKQPILFIGEEVPSLWRKYIKANKTSKTLVAGRCLFDGGAKLLSLEVKVGKGGKLPVLKLINKELLKPLAKAQFVESVDAAPTSASVEEPGATETGATTSDEPGPNATLLQPLLDKGAELVKEATSKRDTLKEVVDNLAPKVNNSGNAVVQDSLIEEAIQSRATIEQLDVNSFLISSKSWVQSVPSDLNKSNKDLATIQKQVEALIKELEDWNKQAAAVVENCKKLQKVQNPEDGPVPPVETDATEAMKKSFARIGSKLDELVRGVTSMFDSLK